MKFQQSNKKRDAVPSQEFSLEGKCRIPLKRQVVGRYQFLGAEIKGRNERIANISKEVQSIWKNKLNFPHVSHQKGNITRVKFL